MDVTKAIRELKEELARVNAMIAVLEDTLKNQKSAYRILKRRGRKAMPREERLLVSERMRKYWAERKAANGPDQPGSNSTD